VCACAHCNSTPCNLKTPSRPKPESPPPPRPSPEFAPPPNLKAPPVAFSLTARKRNHHETADPRLLSFRTPFRRLFVFRFSAFHPVSSILPRALVRCHYRRLKTETEWTPLPAPGTRPVEFARRQERLGVGRRAARDQSAFKLQGLMRTLNTLEKIPVVRGMRLPTGK
jgi:hypothetical protein